MTGRQTIVTINQFENQDLTESTLHDIARPAEDCWLAAEQAVLGF